MNTYELVQSALQLAPWLLVPALMFVVRRWRPRHRYVTVIGLGWMGLLATVAAYWNFSIDYAPNEQIAAHLASRDGAPMTFALFFGWVYVAIYMALLELARLTYQWAIARPRRSQPTGR